jgi:hypothetical protein
MTTCTSKHQVLEAFKAWKDFTEKEAGKTLRVLQSKRGSIFTSQTFKKYLKSEGIKQEAMDPYSPRKNGIF